MSSVPHNPSSISAPILELIRGLRARINCYIFGEGLFAAIGWLMLSFWITLGIDWTFEPPPLVRGLLLVIVFGVLCYLLYQLWFRRWTAHLSDTSLALLLERRFGGFKDSLITTVELQQRPEHARDFHPSMLASTQADALSHLSNVQAAKVLDANPLIQKLLLALVAGASVAVFALTMQEPFGHWWRRSILLDSELWPRKTRLAELDGFRNKVRKVGKGNDVVIVVKADTKFVLPTNVRLSYSSDDGESDSIPLNLVRKANATDEYQEYSGKFSGLTSSINFSIRAGDARLNDYRIEVVDNPTLTQTRLRCRYPAYTHKKNNEFPVTGIMQIPLATEVIVVAKTNKPLARVLKPEIPYKMISDSEFEMPLGVLNEDRQLSFTLLDQDGIQSRENDTQLTLMTIPDEAPKVGLRLSGVGNAITTEAKLPVVGEASDEYGLTRIWIEYLTDQNTNIEQYDLKLPPRIDDIPRTNIIWSKEANPERYDELLHPQDFTGLDLKALQEAPLNNVPKAVDEKPAEQTPPPNIPTQNPEAPKPNSGSPVFYQAPLESQSAAPVNPSTPSANPAAPSPGPATANPAVTAANLTQKPRFALKIGQKLNVVVKALDNSTLQNGPFVGVGERYILEVVSKEQLAAILEAREVLHRQQFETIINEFEITRDNLVAMRYDAKLKKKDALDELEKSSREREEGKKSGKNEERPSEAKKTESDEALLEQELARLKDERNMISVRSLENIERSNHETLRLASAFLEILEEADNNRINTPENQRRLKMDIADPLKKIAAQIVDPENKSEKTLKAQLQFLATVLHDKEKGSAQQKICADLSDKLLAEMRAVLNKMLELEDYNQLLNKVRNLIDEQGKINDETKRLQEQKIRELLEK